MPRHREAFAELERRLRRPGLELLGELRRRRRRLGGLSAREVEDAASALGLPRAQANGVATFYDDFGYGPRAATRVCAGTACFAAGADRAGDDGRQPVYCLGYCYAGPAALDGEQPLAGPDLGAQLDGNAERLDPEIPWFTAVDEPVVFGRLAGAGPEPWSVLGQVDRTVVLDEIKRSGLRGRGGAGFPAAVKWTTAAEAPSDGPRYLIANGDEGDPGSYVDRLLMERDPQGILEGMALAALACGATHGFVYVRSEYPRARDSISAAIRKARAAGHLNEDFDVELFEGAGSYVAGEETALIHSMQGQRGAARPRPPYPAAEGLLGRPTVVNNVETLASIPWIVHHGGERYAALGTTESRGTKVVCLSERFERPGAYEVELGTSVRAIVRELGGGLKQGRALRALQVGGPLGGFLGPDDLDVPLAFEQLREAGVDLGHASLVAFDDSVEPAAILEHVWRFIADESCGACAPCRIGSRRGLELARGMADTRRAAHAGDLEKLDTVMSTMEAASLCAFGQSAPQPVRSLMRVFPELRGAGAA